MAVTIQCPRCTHEQKIDDDKVGQEVACKICHHRIATGAASGSKAKLAPTKNEPQAEAVKAGSPGAVQSKKPPTPAKKPSKKTCDPDDDADDKRPVPRRRAEEKEEGSATGLFMILGGVGAFMVLVILCGGGGLGGYFLFRSDAKPEEQVAQNDPPRKVDNGPRIEEPVPGPELQPFNPGPPPPPQFDPQPGPQNPPPPPPLNPNNPKDIDRALAMLQGQPNDRATAYEWFIAADPNHPRRGQVAQRFERLVDEEARNPFTRFFEAYFRWATRENVQSLTRFAQSNDLGAGDRRQRAMVTLGKLKEVGAADTIASKLHDFRDGDAAFNALTEMGSGAQSAVLKYMNHPDGRVRDRARQLLQGYGTKGDVFLTQSLSDLDSADAGRRGAALQVIAKSTVDDKRKADVSKLLNKSLDNPNCLSNNDLVIALDTWGTKENAAKLAKILDDSRFGNGAAIKILAKLDDPDGWKAIGRCCGNPFNHGEAKNAISKKGVVGEQALIEAFFANKDNNARFHFIRIIGEIGTKNVSGTALLQYIQRNPQDRFFIQNELKKINDRGK